MAEQGQPTTMNKPVRTSCAEALAWASRQSADLASSVALMAGAGLMAFKGIAAARQPMHRSLFLKQWTGIPQRDR